MSETKTFPADQGFSVAKLDCYQAPMPTPESFTPVLRTITDSSDISVIRNNALTRYFRALIYPYYGYYG